MRKSNPQVATFEEYTFTESLYSPSENFGDLLDEIKGQRRVEDSATEQLFLRTVLFLSAFFVCLCASLCGFSY